MLLIALLITAGYGIFVWWMDKKFVRLSHLNIPKHAGNNSFSILIPCRNEEKSIENTVESILNQDFPTSRYEVILIDDHSRDSTTEIMRSVTSKYSNVSSISLPEGSFGKKAALALGIERSRNPWVVTRDADTLSTNRWLTDLDSIIGEKSEMKMWILPVIGIEERTLAERIFALEFMSLMGSGLACAAGKKPILSNGANFCFHKDVIRELEGYDVRSEVSSGDDLFLLMAWYKKGHRIGVAANSSLAVNTPIPRSLSAWMQQRLRWGGKFSSYGLSNTALLGWFIVLTNLTLAATMIAAFIDPSILPSVVLIWIFKLVPEYIFLNRVCTHFGKGRLMWSFLPLSIAYPFLLITTFILSIFTTPRWKGRRVKR